MRTCFLSSHISLMMKPKTAAHMNTGEATSSDEQKYKGVRKRKWGKWVSEIRLPNSRERIWLGSYDSPEKAARAFDAAAFCLRGNSTKFNFPDQPPNIPGGSSLSPSEIQEAAAHFANSFPIPIPSSTAVVPMEADNITTSTSTSACFLPPEIFPGFDDYFMRPPEPPDEYEEESFNYYGDNSQDPSFLWSF